MKLAALAAAFLLLAPAIVRAEYHAYIIDADGVVLGDYKYVSSGVERVGGWNLPEYVAESRKEKKAVARTLRLTMDDSSSDSTFDEYDVAATLHGYFQSPRPFSVVVSPASEIKTAGFPGTEVDYVRYTVSQIVAIGESSVPGTSPKKEGLTLECVVSAVQVHNNASNDKSGLDAKEADEHAEAKLKAEIEARLVREATHQDKGVAAP